MTVSEEIKKNILNLLQGYITSTDKDNDDSLTEMDYNNIITDEELELFYSQAVSQSLSHCYLVNFPTEVILVDGVETVVMNRQYQYGVLLWCAGLIWRKYDIRANDQIEETGSFVISYGDQLIIDAKKQLEPFVYKSVGFW